MFERDDEDDLRSQLTASFEMFDAGKLTAENAHSLDIPKPAAKTESDGGASGADQGGRGGQPGKADSSPAAGADTQSRDRARDDSGRFAKGEGKDADQAAKPGANEPAPADKAKPAQQQPQPGEQPGQQPQQQAAQPEPAPEGLSPRASQLWGKLDPETRAYVQETEQVLAKLADPMRDVFTAAKDINVAWPQYVKNVVAYERALRTNPMETMIALATHHKIDLDQLADYAIARAANGGGQPAPDPNQIHPQINSALAPVLEQVAQLKSQLTQSQQAAEQQRQQAQAARDATVKQELNAFSSSPQAPHWKDVETDVYALLPATRAANPNATIKELLQAAYDRAVWANPTTRAKVQAEQGRAQRSREIEGLTSHRGAPSTPRQPNGQDLPLRAEIEQHWAAFDGR